jgi:hypothetical protein
MLSYARGKRISTHVARQREKAGSRDQNCEQNQQHLRRWRLENREIEDPADVMEKGWSEQLALFRQHYDGDNLDAAELLIPILGSSGSSNEVWDKAAPERSPLS